MAGRLAQRIGYTRRSRGESYAQTIAFRLRICFNDSGTRLFPWEEAMSKQETSRRAVLGGAAVASVAASLEHALAGTDAKIDDAIDVGVTTEPAAPNI